MENTYRLSVGQKILGKNYKWWFLVKNKYKSSSANFFTFIFNTTIRAVEFLAIILIWKLNNSATSIITYLAIGRVFGRLLFTEIDGQVMSDITRGNLTKYLILPSNLFKYYIFDDIGFNLIRSFVNSVIIFILALVLFQQDILLNFNFIYLFPFFILAFFIRTFYSFLFGSIGFWSKDNANSNSLVQACQMVAGLLSGEIIPLFILANYGLGFLSFSPFAFLLHHPMQVYLGKYSPVETFYALLGGLFWSIALYFLADFVYKKGLKRNEAVGM